VDLEAFSTTDDSHLNRTALYQELLFGYLDPITHVKADRPELVCIYEQPPIKDKCRLIHTRVYGLPVNRLEFGPLGGDNDRLGVLAGF
jgi:hypothetical protein